VARSIEVAFHDVELRCRARAVDGWDRTSAYSAYTPFTPLNLVHEPPAPHLGAARYSAGRARIERLVGDPDLPDWQPDRIVAHAPGAKVFVYRQVGQPRLADVTFTQPVNAGDRTYRTIVAGGAPLADFADGYLIRSPFKAPITEISGTRISFEALDEGGGALTLFDAGAGQLQQNPTSLDLWLKVAEFDVHGLPTELAFADPVPGPTGKADVLSYCTRISYLGRLGPASNVAQAMRIPVTPAVPPPFSVETLGIDFYNRTMIKVRFTNPVGGGLYTVWWASGQRTSADFFQNAVPGEYRAQPPYQNRYLFDVLSLPVPETRDRNVTIGVQQVNEGEGQSDFETVQIVLPALVP
jgi:hypothetical protein